MAAAIQGELCDVEVFAELLKVPRWRYSVNATEAKPPAGSV